MRSSKIVTAWVTTAAAVMAVIISYAAAPVHGQDRIPRFTAYQDTTYGQLRELTGRSMGERLDPTVPWELVVYGGQQDRYPLTDADMRTLSDGGRVPGVDHLDSFDRLGDDVAFGDTQNEVVYKIGRMIRGWLFTVVRPEGNYHVFCYTDGKEVLCEVLTPIEI